MVYSDPRIILEAIDQLRLRKARPDFQRICNFLMRNFSISPSEVKIKLDQCIEDGIVLKVEYKGNISYRNATRNRKSKHSNIPFNRSDSGDTIVSLSTGPSKKFRALLINAYTELIVQEPDYLDIGVPGNELILKILSKDSVRSYTKKYLNILIDKLSESGMLTKVPESGNYFLGPNLNVDLSVNKLIEDKKSIKINNKSKGVKSISKKSKMEAGANSNNNKSNNIRVGSRRKRAKKVFDPSDNNIPKKRGRPPLLNKLNIEKPYSKPRDSSDNEAKTETITSSANREQGGVCSVCHNNKKHVNDQLVSCRECSNKAHLSCLNGDDMMLKMYPDNTWQCPHCKTCCICYETSDAGILMVCTICADAYHAGCHDPRIADKYKNGTKWFCTNCQMAEQLQVTEIHPNVQKNNIIKHELIDEEDIKEELPSSVHSPSASSSSPSSDEDSKDSLPSSQTPPTLSPQAARSLAESPLQHGSYASFQNCLNSDFQSKIDPSIPDATHWTSEDVYNYFVQYFPEEAKVFKDQEIDGRSLLLMKRWDVLTSLKLKLGPALNIYRHVVKLQFRRDDPKLYWL